jgi:hypothetical protein
MLENSRLDAQLVPNRAVLSTIELNIKIKIEMNNIMFRNI